MKMIRFALALFVRDPVALTLIGAIILLVAAAWEGIWPRLLP
jgi:hypothetical protein